MTTDKDKIIRLAVDAGLGLSAHHPSHYPAYARFVELITADAHGARSLEVAKLQRDYEAIRAVCSNDQATMAILIQERDQARASFNRAADILMGIYGLLYPVQVTDEKGVTWGFQSQNVHEQMQQLSDKIRLIPDQLKAPDEAAKKAASGQ